MNFLRSPWEGANGRRKSPDMATQNCTGFIAMLTRETAESWDVWNPGEPANPPTRLVLSNRMLENYTLLTVPMRYERPNVTLVRMGGL